MKVENKIKNEGVGLKLIEGFIYILFVILGFYFAFLVIFDFQPSYYNIAPFYENIPFIIIVTIIVFYIYDIVSTIKKTFNENVLIILISLIIIDMATATIIFLRKGFGFPQTFFLLGFLFQLILIISTKYIILKILKKRMNQSKIMIIGNEKERENIQAKIQEDRHRKTNDIVKFKMGEDLYSIQKRVREVDKLYIGSSVSDYNKEKIISYATQNNKTIYLVPSFLELSLVDFKVRQANDLLIFKINDLGLTSEQKFVKRTMDLIVAIFALLFFLPLMIIVAILIKCSDGGKVLYKQNRVTKNNREFVMYKFRTMIDNAEMETGPVLSTEADPRITKIGKILRSTRIDELPQFINVLKGDMSVVGPRPERRFFAESHSQDVEYFKYRTKVKAGITGFAQVMGTYATAPEEKVKYDLLYIRNYSVLLDIKILFHTIKIIFVKNSSRGISNEIADDSH